MAIKTIEYKIRVSGITPSVEQSAGMQGDHCVTKISISIDDELYSLIMRNYENSNLLYRFDVIDGEGGIWQSEVKLLDQNPSLMLEERHTRHGGKINVYLVITALTQDNQTEMELYSFPILLRLKSKPDGTYQAGENYESVSSLATKAEISANAAREFADEVIEKLKNGEFDGKDGVSVTHEWNGTVLTIESASGKTSADLKGDKGDKGDMPDISGLLQKAEGDTYTNQAYIVTASGDQQTMTIEEPTWFVGGTWDFENCLPRRNGNGNLYTNIPIVELECANKKYVDDIVGDIDIALDELHNYAQVIIGGAK